jgi:hypothetical protein
LVKKIEGILGVLISDSLPLDHTRSHSAITL